MSWLPENLYEALVIILVPSVIVQGWVIRQVLSVLKAILDEMADGADAESKVLSAIIRGKSTLQ